MAIKKKWATTVAPSCLPAGSYMASVKLSKFDYFHTDSYIEIR